MLDGLDCAFAGSQVDEQTLVNGLQGLRKYGGDKLKISRVLESGGGGKLKTVERPWIQALATDEVESCAAHCAQLRYWLVLDLYWHRYWYWH